jgi:uncharacterized RDD family membrane protein YckC
VLIGVGFVLLPFVTPQSPTAMAARPSSFYVMSRASRALSAAAAIAATATYCGWFWSGGRRTLAMKTWHLTLTTASGEPVGIPRALARYLACFIGPALAIAAFAALQSSSGARWTSGVLALNYVWAMVDPERRFLQDRIAGTELRRDSP